MEETDHHAVCGRDGPDGVISLGLVQRRTGHGASPSGQTSSATGLGLLGAGDQAVTAARRKGAVALGNINVTTTVHMSLNSAIGRNCGGRCWCWAGHNAAPKHGLRGPTCLASLAESKPGRLRLERRASPAEPPQPQGDREFVVRWRRQISRKRLGRHSSSTGVRRPRYVPGWGLGGRALSAISQLYV